MYLRATFISRTAAVILLVGIACASAFAQGQPTNKFVYFNSQLQANQVYAYQLLDDGTLASVGVYPTGGTGDPYSGTMQGSIVVAKAANAAFVYAANEGDGSISNFAIDPATGILTLVAVAPCSATGGHTSMATSADGQFLVSACGGSVTAYAIQADGSLLSTGWTYPVSGEVMALGMSQNGHAVVTSLSGTQRLRYRFHLDFAGNSYIPLETGTPLAQQEDGHVFNCDGSVLYSSIYQDSYAGAAVYSVAPDFTLTPASSLSYPTAGGSANAMTLSNSGRRAYVTATNAIVTYDAAADSADWARELNISFPYKSAATLANELIMSDDSHFLFVGREHGIGVATLASIGTPTAWNEVDIIQNMESVSHGIAVYPPAKCFVPIPTTMTTDAPALLHYGETATINFFVTTQGQGTVTDGHVDPSRVGDGVFAPGALQNGTYAFTWSGPVGTWNFHVQYNPLIDEPWGASGVDYSIQVTKAAAIHVTVDNKTRPVNTANPPLTGTMTGVLPGDNITVQYSTTAQTNSPAGNYPITATLIDPDNRLVNYDAPVIVNGTMNVYVSNVDLIESSVRFTTPVAGAFNVTDTAKNIGTTTAFGTAVTRYYLSLTNTKSAAAIPLAGSRSVIDLAAGAASTGTVATSIPANVTGGMYYVIACADDGNAIVETAEYNNCSGSGVPMAIGPDLIESGVSFTTPVAGNFTVTDTAKNIGTATATGTAVTNYYLSLTTSKSNSSILLPGSRNVTDLPAGSASTGSVATSIPSGVAAGYYYVLACADTTNAITESSETNNCSSSGVPTAIGPDLIESSVTFTTPVAGNFNITDTGKNIGTSTATGTAVTTYFLSLTNKKDGSSVPLAGSRSFTDLASGATSTGTVATTVPDSLPAGYYYVIACADSGNAIAESAETNNCSSSGVPLKK